MSSPAEARQWHAYYSSKLSSQGPGVYPWADLMKGWEERIRLMERGLNPEEEILKGFVGTIANAWAPVNLEKFACLLEKCIVRLKAEEQK
jgi:hypothetical protein